jgi:hypothetical protein
MSGANCRLPIPTNAAYFLRYQAAQIKLGDKGFLSRDITVDALVRNRSDVHHVYPRNHLKKQGLSRSRYNQIANFVLAQSEINIAIGDKPPSWQSSATEARRGTGESPRLPNCVAISV